MNEPGPQEQVRTWLTGPVVEIAPLLLGALLTSSSPEGDVTVRLTEVEAYDGARDPGSHAFRGRTGRNAVMFGPAGHLYVYRHLGLHHCVNLVTGPTGTASAVLLRAGEVVQGAEVARARRSGVGVTRSDVDLAQGPARLAVALGLDLADDGADVLTPRGRFHLALGAAPAGWSSGPRVGVAGTGGTVSFPWRFWLPGEPTVSVYRAAAPRRRVPRGPAGTAH